MADSNNDYNFKSVATLSKTIQILIAIKAILTLVDICGIVATTGYISSPVGMIVSLLHAVVYIPAGILFLLWMRRAFRNLKALNITGLKNREWYCIWGFFVPIACLIIPMSVVSEIWKASDPTKLDQESWKENKASMLIIIWWIAWLSQTISSLIAAKMNIGLEQSIIYPGLLHILAAVLAILVVKNVSDRQQKKALLLQS